MFYTLLNIIWKYEPISFFEKMFNLLALKGIDSLWFLPTYILAEIIMELIGNQRTYGKKFAFYHDIMQFFNSDIFIRLYEHLVFGYTL